MFTLLLIITIAIIIIIIIAIIISTIIIVIYFDTLSLTEKFHVKAKSYSDRLMYEYRGDIHCNAECKLAKKQIFRL